MTSQTPYVTFQVLEDKKRNEVGSKLAAVEAKVAEASKLEVKAKSEVNFQKIK